MNREHLNKTFANCFIFNRLDAAKYLAEKFPLVIDPVYDKCAAFRYGCEHGHLEAVKWLIHKYPIIDPHIHAEYSFRYACENGHLDVAKWLKQEWPDIDHKIFGNYPHTWASKNNHNDVVEWLNTL